MEKQEQDIGQPDVLQVRFAVSPREHNLFLTEARAVEKEISGAAPPVRRLHHRKRARKKAAS